MWIKPSEILFLIGFIAYVATRGVYESRSRSVVTIERRIDAVERVLLAFVMLGSLVLPLAYLFTPLLNFANYALPAWTLWIGGGVLAISLWVFWRSHADLDRNWSVSLEIRERHVLVTHGVYRSIRHPMYAAIFLFGLAQALLLHNWLAGFSALVTFVPLYLVRTPREERMMRDQFGEAYEAYSRRTGRLIPRLTKKT